MAINFHIKTDGFDLTPDVTSYIHEKLGVIEKYLGNVENKEVLAEVEVGRRLKGQNKGDVFRAEINLTHEGKMYRAVTKAGDIFSALDELKDEIGKEVKRSLNKKEDIFRRSARKLKEMLRMGK